MPTLVKLTTANSAKTTAAPSTSPLNDVVAYYDACTGDYFDWSADFDMHFGYWRWGLNPFKREPMLRETNAQLLQLLGFTPADAPRIADLGCGVAATARALAHALPRARIDAVTISPIQIELALQMNAADVACGLLLDGQVRLHERDYTQTGLPSNSFDAVYAIESACYAAGADKAAFFAEAWRLLKPGGRLVVIDGFLRRPASGLFALAYRWWCQGWAITQMAEITPCTATIGKLGFENIKARDWSWRMAASFAHVPLLATRFTAKLLWRSRANAFKLPAWRWRHIAASFLSPVLGAQLWRFGYFALSASKPIELGYEVSLLNGGSAGFAALSSTQQRCSNNLATVN